MRCPNIANSRRRCERSPPEKAGDPRHAPLPQQPLLLSSVPRPQAWQGWAECTSRPSSRPRRPCLPTPRPLSTHEDPRLPANCTCDANSLIRNRQVARTHPAPGHESPGAGSFEVAYWPVYVRSSVCDTTPSAEPSWPGCPSI